MSGHAGGARFAQPHALDAFRKLPIEPSVGGTDHATADPRAHSPAHELDCSCPRGRAGHFGTLSSLNVRTSTGFKTVAAAITAIAGMTFALGVVVTAPGYEQKAPRADAGVARRPRLSANEDVRHAALHFAHLEAQPEKVECGRCHEQDRKNFTAPRPEKCLECHEKHEPGVHRKDEKARDCLACHDFALVGDAKEKARDCVACHAEPQNDRRAIVVHAKESCVRCHAPHDRSESRPPCVECHEKLGSGHRGGKDGNEVCMSCHAPHEFAKAAKGSCEVCHAKEEPLVVAAAALRRDGHDACVKCHENHDRTKGSVTRCSKCHANKPVLADTVLEHQACTSCHEPHDPLGAPGSRCPKCHEKIAAAHPKNDDGQACTGCHRPHDPLAEPGRIALACTAGCHEDRRDSGASHGTAACSDCHAPHEFKLTATGPEFCKKCHASPKGNAKAIATSSGHSVCAKCHTSAAHDPAAARPACSSCHEDKVKKINDGHANCGRCHETHSGKRLAEAATCSACHKDEAGTAPAGHSDCQKCHSPHEKGRKPEAETCTGSCHADKKQARHASIEGGCESCHRPHGPKGKATVPDCTSCHSPNKLQLMHMVSDHQKCRSCHGPHAAQKLDRDTCLACHKDQVMHEPNAQVCVACHPFRTGS